MLTLGVAKGDVDDDLGFKSGGFRVLRAAQVSQYGEGGDESSMPRS